MTHTRLSANRDLGRVASAVVLLVALAAQGLARSDHHAAKAPRPEKSIWVQLVPAPGWQKGCPLQVAAVVPQNGNLVGYVAVINRSHEPVQGFTLAIVGSDLNAGRLLGVYRTIDVREEVPARGLLSLRPHAGTLVEAARFANEHGASSVGFTVAIARTPGFARSFDAKRLDDSEELDVLDDPFDELEARIQADIEAFLSEHADASRTPEDTTNVATPDGGGLEPTGTVHCVTPNPNEPAGNGQCSVKLTTTGGASTPTCTVTQCPRWPRPCNRQVCGNAVIITP
jgi:hypothetical protein